MQTLHESLDQVEVFRRVSVDRRAEIATRCNWRKVRAGAMIQANQDQSRCVSFLASGRARALVYSQTGVMVGFGDLHPGQMFGEAQAIDGLPRIVSVEAVETCTVATLSADGFLRLVREEPDFAWSVLEQIVRNVRALTARVLEFSTMSVTGRLHAELLRLADAGIGDGHGGVRLRVMPTHAELAARISTHREAVTRELNRLQKAGLLGKEGRNLLIRDLEGMRRLLKPEAGG